MITSKDNPQIKELRKLHKKKHRAQVGFFAAEGEDLVSAALAAGWEPEAVYCAPGAPPEFLEHRVAYEVDKDVLDGASALGSGSRVIAVFAKNGAPLHDRRVPAVSLHLAGIADPGNVGTLIRSAHAFIDGSVSLGEGCADPYSPKALRAAMGSTFVKPPLLGFDPPAGAKVVALDADGDVAISEVAVDGPVVVLAGAERQGLSELTLLDADVVASVPMLAGGPESLNVAMAATIALYELSKGIARQTPN